MRCRAWDCAFVFGFCGLDRGSLTFSAESVDCRPGLRGLISVENLKFKPTIQSYTLDSTTPEQSTTSPAKYEADTI